MKLEMLTGAQKHLVSGAINSGLISPGGTLYELISDLTDRLAAAERIVDHAIAHASYAGTRIQAQEYRSLYPKVPHDE